MRVNELLQSMPGIGKVRAQQVMEKLKISETRRVRGLAPSRSPRWSTSSPPLSDR